MLGLQNTYSLLHGCVKYSYVSSGTASERDAVVVKKGYPVLYLFDDGYLDLKKQQKQIDTAGSYYIVRGRCNHACEIISAKVNGKVDFSLNGQKISEIRDFKNKSVIDAMVKFKDGSTYRLIRFWNKKDKELCYLFTNIPETILDSVQITNLFKTRWQCEICWKFMKSVGVLPPKKKPLSK